MSHRRNGFRKQIREAEEGLLELGREQGKGAAPGGGGGTGDRCGLLPRGRAPKLPCSFTCVLVL